MITLIAAAAQNDALGYQGDLLWHLPDDFKHFKSLTTGHSIIMGRKTFETFPKLLPNRKHIIISRQPDFRPEGCQVYSSVREALDQALRDDENPYVIGGGEIYRATMPFADRIELTRVHDDFEPADAFFPTISPERWHKIHSEYHSKDDKHNIDFTFETYIRRK